MSQDVEKDEPDKEALRQKLQALTETLRTYERDVRVQLVAFLSPLVGFVAFLLAPPAARDVFSTIWSICLKGVMKDTDDAFK